MANILKEDDRETITDHRFSSIRMLKELTLIVVAQLVSYTDESVVSYTDESDIKMFTLWRSPSS